MNTKSSFHGLSTLREAEKKKAAASAGNSALQEYLKKYTSEPKQTLDKKVKKKKVKKESTGAVRVYDQDISGFKPVETGRPRQEVEEEDAPVIANPEEAKALAAQQAMLKEGNTIREDGSGWVAVGDELPGTKPPRRARHDSPDLDLPRKGRHDSPDLDLPRNARHDSPDIEPPRKARHDSPDLDLPRKGRHDSPDIEPPRKTRNHSPELVVPRHTRHDSPELDPPRKGRHDSPDFEPPRKNRNDSPDAEPPRRQRNDSPDIEPPRKARGGSSSDVEVPRRGQQEAQGAPTTSSRPGQRTMADGTAAGLVSRDVFRAEQEQAQLKRLANKQVAPGAEAATVYRNKVTGQVTTEEEFKSSREKKKRKKAEEVFIPWRGGLAQQQQAEERGKRMAEEAQAPFARYADDGQLDEVLRDRQRWGDPMAGKTAKRVEPEDMSTKYDKDALEKSGFNIPQAVPPHSWLKRGAVAPENRYGIRPGKHWDGVDRSCGFERDLFRHRNSRVALEQEALMWSQADM